MFYTSLVLLTICGLLSSLITFCLLCLLFKLAISMSTLRFLLDLKAEMRPPLSGVLALFLLEEFFSLRFFCTPSSSSSY